MASLLPRSPHHHGIASLLSGLSNHLILIDHKLHHLPSSSHLFVSLASLLHLHPQPTQPQSTTTMNKSFLSSSLLSLLLCAFFFMQTTTTVDAFTPPLALAPARAASSSSSTTRLYFFGGPKDDGSPGDYVCKVRNTRKARVKNVWRVE